VDAGQRVYLGIVLHLQQTHHPQVQLGQRIPGATSSLAATPRTPRWERTADVLHLVSIYHAIRTCGKEKQKQKQKQNIN
jgi:hypothetical protein